MQASQQPTNERTANEPLAGSLEETASAVLWGRRALLLIGGLLLVRLLYLWLFPLDLVHDEAYYWDWSRQLDWGYYSKPPMIAWLIGGSTRLLGSTPFAVRLPATLLGTAGLLVVYQLARQLYGPRVGFWAVLLSAATPGSAALGVIMTIDAPLLFCWTTALWGFWNLIQEGGRRWRWLAVTTLATGLGLLSKQTMLAFFLAAGLFLVVSPLDRGSLKRPWIWLLGVVSLLFLTPVLWWNSAHGWITLQHTSEHFSHERITLLERFRDCGEFLAAQAGVATPLTWGLLVIVVLTSIAMFFRLDRRERFLLCFGGLPLLAVVALSLKQRVEPNWPAPFYVGPLILLSAWLEGQVAKAPWLSPARRWRTAAVSLGAVSVVGVYLLPVTLWMSDLEGSKLDPVVRLRGWSQLGAAVGEQFHAVPRPAQTFVLVATGRTETSELAFYLPDQPRVYLWSPDQQVRSQYDVWGGPRQKQGWDALIVGRPGEPLPAEVQAAFTQLESHADIQVPVGNGRKHHYQLWQARGFRGWQTSRISTQPGNSQTH